MGFRTALENMRRRHRTTMQTQYAQLTAWPHQTARRLAKAARIVDCGIADLDPTHLEALDTERYRARERGRLNRGRQFSPFAGLPNFVSLRRRVALLEFLPGSLLRGQPSSRQFRPHTPRTARLCEAGLEPVQ